ncbi:protein of unknown function [Desulfuromusa kysingii]|uniref:DUF4381 domain-containing protein n=1 Tax=Desulfuromusa kysingii TaxID=37625 RepID=A0A1H3ZIS8_9BACT|nr:DUF4381 domain-containing protein [Desulfuromusa kysingii]SEA23232.1 protein of unknown function [Desulfuromusa kysingii]
MQPIESAQTAQKLPLRDIHLPPTPSWWPLAPGWYLLIVLLLLILLLLWFLWQRAQRLRYRRQVLQQLDQLAKMDSDHTLIAELSVLLRRSALHAFPDENCAALNGEEWLQFLDRHAAEPSFTTGIGRCLAAGPYQPTSEVDRDALLALCRCWLKRLPPTLRSRRKG